MRNSIIVRIIAVLSVMMMCVTPVMSCVTDFSGSSLFESQGTSVSATDSDTLVSLNPVSEWSEMGQMLSVDGVDCTLYDNGTVRLDKLPSKYTTTDHLIIPATLKIGSDDDYAEYSVTVIGKGVAASLTTGIVKLTIPDSIVKIEDGTPASGGDYLIMPGSKTQTTGALDFSNVSSVEIGEGSQLEYIGDGAFRRSPITGMTLPSTVKYIGTLAFGSVTSITIHSDNSIVHIKEGAFQSLTSAVSFSLPGLQFIGGAKPIGNADVTWPVDSDGQPMFVKINDVVYNKDKTVALFYSGSPSAVAIEDGTKTVADRAFLGASMTEMTIPDSLEYIGAYAFANCITLKYVTFTNDSSLKEIGEYAFTKGWSYYSGDFVLQKFGWKDGSITIPASTVTIGDNAFASINSLGDTGVQFTSATSIQEIEIADESKLEKIGNYAFYGRDPTKIILGTPSEESNGLIIGNGAFSVTKYPYASSSLEVVEFLPSESNIISIGNHAFTSFFSSTAYASKLEQFGNESGKIIIPAPVEYIGSFALSGSFINLSSNVNYLKGTPSISGIEFEPGSKIKEIGSYAFINYNNCTVIDIVNCTVLEKIGTYAFYNNAGEVTSEISLPSSNTDLEIGGYAFYGRTSGGGTFTIPASVVSIGDYAFSVKSSSVTSNFVFEGNIIMLGTTPFGSSSVPMVLLSATGALTIGSGITVINDAILKSQNITSIAVHEGNSYFSLQNGLLYLEKDGKKMLIKSVATDPLVMISEDVDVVRGYAFYGCNSIKAVVIEGKDTAVEALAFGSCLSLVSVLTSSSNISRSAFLGVSGLAIFEPIGSDISDHLIPLGTYGGKTYSGDDGTVAFNPSIKGQSVTVTDGAYSDGRFTFKLSITGGYSQYDIVVMSESGTIYTATDGVYSVDTSSLAGDAILLTVTAKPRTGVNTVNVTVYGNGGYFTGGAGPITVSIPKGMSILHSDIEIPRMNKAEIIGWTSDSVNGPVFDLYGDQINGDISLYPIWADADPLITFNEKYGKIVIETQSSTINSGDRYEGYVDMTFVPDPGYELVRWKITAYGYETIYAYSAENFRIENDTVIEAEVRLYAGPSVIPILQTETPTGEGLMMSWIIGGYMDTSNMSSWKGHSSVPVVVDNYMYVRISDRLYKIESDTGYVVKAVESKSVAAFYHYVGCGNAQILDYATGNVYDLDLNLIYRMPSGMTSATYNDGYFYGPTIDNITGEMVIVKFSADYIPGSVTQKSIVNGWKVISAWHSQYGQTSAPIFADGYMYFLSSSGDERHINCVNVNDSNDYHRLSLDGIKKHLWSEGRLTYDNGTIYLTTYVEQLFGGAVSSDNSTIVSIPVSNGVFGEPEYTRISLNIGGKLWNAKDFTSQFIVYEGKGYINTSDYVIVYDVGSMTPLYWCEGVRSHGGMVISTYHDEGIYLYVVPYNGANDILICLDDGTKVYDVNTGFMATDYNSQAFRTDIDGRLIYYNDSGWVRSLTVAENNPYYFFIEGDGEAKWVVGYGENASAALKDAGYTTIPGNAYALVSLASAKDPTHLPGEYEWRAVPDNNLESSDYTAVHYYIITNGDINAVPDSLWMYDGNLYKFTENIGDRSLIGVTLTDVIRVDGVSVEKNSADMNIGDEMTLSYQVSPQDAYLRDVVWSSSDASVAYVDQDGRITANNVGTATITVTTADGSYTASCTVTVYAEVIAIEPDAETSGGTTTATVTETEIENAVSQANASDDSVIIISVPSGSSERVVVNIPASGLLGLIKDVEMKITTSTGTIVFDSSALSTMAEAGDSLEITIGRADASSLTDEQKNKVGDNPVFNITARADGIDIGNLNGAATVTLPYELDEGKDSSLLTVWYIDGAGNVTEHECVYDPIAGTVTFETNHFSHYAIVYSVPAAGDSDGDGGINLYVAVAVVILIIALIAIGFFVYNRGKGDE